GWDFEDTWDIIEEETYPFLQWQVEDNYPYSPELEKYELTINIEGEGMVKVDGTEVEEGWTQEYIGVTEVALEGIPDEGWEFNEWTGTDETGDETTIKMNKDKEITAHFEIKTYNLTVETTGEGLIDIEPEKVEYEHGEVVNLTAVPDESWAFVNWTGNKTGSNETITVMMNEDKEITARFKEKDDDGGGTPGFTTMSLLVASIIALAIYHKKKR
ncbi:MAG: InlB B-repeat-containing protein, partial [Candidatus Aenigmatarchaeota archaeon]